MFRFFCFIVSSICFCNCSQHPDEVPAGGACTYRYDTTGVRVIAVDSISPGQLNIIALLNSDTVNFFDVNGRYISADEMKRDNIQVNDSVCFIAGTITNGSCNPQNNHIEVKRFSETDK